MSRNIDPLNMSLDQIISHRETSHTNNQRRGRAGPVSMAIKGSTTSNRRATRQGQAAPYDPSQRNSSHSYHHNNNGSNNNNTGLRAEAKHDAALKFLLSNGLAGTLIGNGGSSVREMMDITDAAVHVSNHADYYPGTKERVIYITGPLAAVNLAQSLVWEMIGQQADASARNNGNPLTVVTWEPSNAKNNPGQYDEVSVTGRISIPSIAGGLIVGRGGNTIRSLADDSGLDSLTIDNKEDGEVTYERVLTLQGSVASCMKCTSLILEKLQEQRHELTTHNYVCNGTGYAKVLRGNNNGGGSSGGGHVSGGASVTGGSSISPRGGGIIRHHHHDNNDEDFTPRNPGRTVFTVSGK